MELQQGGEGFRSILVVGGKFFCDDLLLSGGDRVFEAQTLSKESAAVELHEVGGELGAIRDEAAEDGCVGLIAAREEVAEFIGDGD